MLETKQRKKRATKAELLELGRKFQDFMRQVQEIGFAEMEARYLQNSEEKLSPNFAKFSFDQHQTSRTCVEPANRQKQ